MPSVTYPWPVAIVNGIPSIVNPGALRHNLQFQQQVQSGSFNESGTEIIWQPFSPGGSQIVTGALIPYKGRDVTKNGQTTSELSILSVFWFVPGILPNMRIIAPNGSAYIIQDVENVLEMDMVLVLYCLGLGPNI